MATLSRRTDAKGRVTLPKGYSNCLVVIEEKGDALLIRRVQRVVGRRYTFAELMAQVTSENIHGEVDAGPAVGNEAL